MTNYRIHFLSLRNRPAWPGRDAPGVTDLLTVAADSFAHQWNDRFWIHHKRPPRWSRLRHLLPQSWWPSMEPSVFVSDGALETQWIIQGTKLLWALRDEHPTYGDAVLLHSTLIAALVEREPMLHALIGSAAEQAIGRHGVVFWSELSNTLCVVQPEGVLHASNKYYRPDYPEYL